MSAGIYAQLDPTILNHRKTRRLMTLAGVSRTEAIGVLATLWCVVLVEAPDGCLDGWQPADIESAVDWPGQEGKLFEALVTAGWLRVDDDGTTHVNDWNEYTGKALWRRAKRARDARERRRRQDVTPRDVTSHHVSSHSANVTPEQEQEQEPEQEQEQEHEPEVKSSLVDDMLFDLRPQDVLDGMADVAAKEVLKSKKVAEALCAIHNENFGGRLSPKSKSLSTTLKQLIGKEGRQPSEVARAIIGMSRDPWPGRKEHSGWQYLVKHFDKWVGYYHDSPSAGPTGDGAWGPWRDEGFATKEEWDEWKKRT